MIKGYTYDSRRPHQRCNPLVLYRYQVPTGQTIYQAGVSQRIMNTCSPLSLGNIGTPFLPVFRTIAILLKAFFFFRKEGMAVKQNHFR